MKFETDELEIMEPSFEMVMKTENESDDEDVDQEELELDYKDIGSNTSNSDADIKVKIKKRRANPDHIKVGKRAQRAMKRMNEEFDESMLPSIEEKIKSFEQQIIPAPSNDREIKKNKNIERNIALQKAFKEIVTTGCSNRKAASKV